MESGSLFAPDFSFCGMPFRTTLEAKCSCEKIFQLIAKTFGY